MRAAESLIADGWWKKKIDGCPTSCVYVERKLLVSGSCAPSSYTDADVVGHKVERSGPKRSLAAPPLAHSLYSVAPPFSSPLSSHARPIISHQPLRPPRPHGVCAKPEGIFQKLDAVDPR